MIKARFENINENSTDFSSLFGKDEYNFFSFPEDSVNYYNEPIDQILPLNTLPRPQDIITRENKYKLILMDITMPVMDGIEAAKNIQKMIDEHKLYDTVKIIFISAHVNLDLSNILSGIKCAIDYYAKPINTDKYKSLLDKYYYSK